jgi:wyosine [tRNA(Phe)-imidazoG37] synthetase (radical SAM superfamily)
MALDPVLTEHPRLFEDNRFVYPVISRRSKGLSIGINLNPDKVCNFDCIYCQVNRSAAGLTRFVDVDGVLDELDTTLEFVASGRLFQHERFCQAPESLRRLNDIAFSGDGEPTTYRNFPDIVAACAEIKRRRALHDVKILLITNASMFHRDHVRRALGILDQNNGEIWAKLDAGTEEYFQRVDRAGVPLKRILTNITQAAAPRPIVIQSLFMRIQNEAPPPTELLAFCRRLNEIATAGGQIKLVQVYTVARQPAESYVTPLEDCEVDAIADLVRHQTGLAVESYYGAP